MNGLKRLRMISGQSVEEVAKKAGMAAITIYRYEAGLYRPKASKIKAYAEALGCSAEDLVDAIEKTS